MSRLTILIVAAVLVALVVLYKIFKKKPLSTGGSISAATEFFEVSIDDGAVCSDPQCPCPETPIPRGKGYLYVFQDMIDFRRDALSLQEAVNKINRMQSDAMKRGVMMRVDPRMATPILMCEQGAKKRRLNLEVAAADARMAWETGKAPLRPTPLA